MTTAIQGTATGTRAPSSYRPSGTSSSNPGSRGAVDSLNRQLNQPYRSRAAEQRQRQARRGNQRPTTRGRQNYRRPRFSGSGNTPSNPGLNRTFGRRPGPISTQQPGIPPRALQPTPRGLPSSPRPVPRPTGGTSWGGPTAGGLSALGGAIAAGQTLANGGSPQEAIGAGVGTGIGSYGGGVAGAAVGTLVGGPGVGTAVGGLIGSAIGGWIGGELGQELGDLVDGDIPPDAISNGNPTGNAIQTPLQNADEDTRYRWVYSVTRNVQTQDKRADQPLPLTVTGGGPGILGFELGRATTSRFGTPIRRGVYVLRLRNGEVSRRRSVKYSIRSLDSYAIWPEDTPQPEPTPVRPNQVRIPGIVPVFTPAAAPMPVPSIQAPPIPGQTTPATRPVPPSEQPLEVPQPEIPTQPGDYPAPLPRPNLDRLGAGSGGLGPNIGSGTGTQTQTQTQNQGATRPIPGTGLPNPQLTPSEEVRTITDPVTGEIETPTRPKTDFSTPPPNPCKCNAPVLNAIRNMCEKNQDGEENEEPIGRFREEFEPCEDDGVTQAFGTLTSTESGLSLIADGQSELLKALNLIWEAVKCPEEIYASLPELFQAKAPKTKPQMQVQYKRTDIKGHGSRWHISIPHFDYSRRGAFDPFPYQKGSYMCVLELPDNSQIVANCINPEEGRRLIGHLSSFLELEFQVPIASMKYSFLPNRNLQEILVTPSYLKFFEGPLDEPPLWLKRLK